MLFCDPVTYAIRTDPLPSSTQETQPTQPGSDQNSDHASDKSATDTDTPGSKARARGIGSSHKDGKLRKYSLWLRICFTHDVRVSGMSIKDAIAKHGNPERRVAMYPQEELKKLYRVKGAWRKVKDQVLEKKLVDYYNQLNIVTDSVLTCYMHYMSSLSPQCLFCHY